MSRLGVLAFALLVTLVTTQPTGDARNENISFVVDAVGNRLPAPAQVPSKVGSPSNLLHPDRYEFYTFDETGELVKRLMTLEEIQAIVASEDDEDGHLVTLAQASPNKPAIAFNFSHPPHVKVHSVVTNVQNVLKAEMEAQKNKPSLPHFLDTPDVSASWSAILPSIFGNTGIDIVPDKAPSAFGTPETDTLDAYVTKSETITESTQSISEEAKEEPTIDNDLTVENSNNKLTEDIMTTFSPKKITSMTTEATTTTTPKATTIPTVTSTQKTTVTKTKLTQKPPVKVTTKTPTNKPTPVKVKITKTPIKSTTPRSDIIPVTQKPTPTTLATKKPITTKIKLSTTTEIPTTSVQLIEIFNTNKNNQSIPTNLPETTTLKEYVTHNTTINTPSPNKVASKPIGEVSNYVSAASHVSPTTPIAITTYRPILNGFPSSQVSIASATQTAATKKPGSTSNDLSTSHTTLSNPQDDAFSTVGILKPTEVTETKFVSIPMIDNESPPVFNVADSISQIASDLGNIFSTPEPNSGHNLGLEIKENVDINIPIDLKTEVPVSKITTTTEVDPFTLSISTEQKLDSGDSDIYFVKLTTKNTSLAASSLTLDRGSSTYPSLLNSEITTEPITIKREPSTTYATTEAYTETPLPSIMELSGSVTDLLSQVTNDAPLTMLEISDDTTSTSEAPINRHEDMDIITTTSKALEIEMENKEEKESEISTVTQFVTTELYSSTENVDYLGNTPTYDLNTGTSTELEKSVTDKQAGNISSDGSSEYTTESKYTTSVQENSVTSEEPETSTLLLATIEEDTEVNNTPKTEFTTETSSPIVELTDLSKYVNLPTPVTDLPPTQTSEEEKIIDKNPSSLKNKTESLLINEETLNTKVAVLTTLDKHLESPLNSSSVSNEEKLDISSSSSLKEDSSIQESKQPLVDTTENNVQNVKNDTGKPSTQNNSESTTSKVEVINISEDLSVSATSSPLLPSTTIDITKKVETITKVPATIQKQTSPPNRFDPSTSQISLSTSSNEVKNTTEKSVDKETVKPVIPKPDDPKKKIQKVNIDSKEHLGTSQNNSWKLISTVSPPNNDIKNLSGVNTGVNSMKPLPYQKPKPMNDPNKQLNLDGSNENQGLESTTKNLDDDVYQFTELCNELAFRYWSTLTNHNIDRKRSLVISPFAINSMLAMMFMGARGGTSGEMNEILKLDDMVTFNPHFTLKNISDSIEISKQSGVAASAFVRELYSDREKGKILAFYKERAQQFYNGHVEETNFKLINDIIRRRTNLLVKRHTWGKIPEYLKGNSISMQPPLAALSVNVFETDCTSSSSEGRDGEMYFVVSPSVRQRRLVPVPSAVYTKGFLAGYEPVLDATVAAVGTASAVVSTIFVMPGQQGNSVQADDIDELQKRLLDASQTADPWNRLLRTLLPRMGLELQIPRFSHRSVLNISSTLKEMGLKDLFDPEEADLRGLNGLANDLYLSDMIHATTFATCGENMIGDLHHVESYPTEPARAKRSMWWFKPRQEMSSLSDGWDEPRDYQRAFHDPHDLGAMYMPLHLRPRQARLPQATEAARLKFDRPFLFFVRHNPSGMILYMGRYNPRLLP